MQMSASSFQAVEPFFCVGLNRWRPAFNLLATFFCLSALSFSSAARALSQAGVECEIATNRKDQLLVVQAIAKSPSAVSGTYRLVLVKHGASGTSQSIQQGNFDLQPGSDGLLATTVVDAPANTELTARLLVETDRGVSQCGLPQ
ncbi:curli-like amyloid fiber formation chaperone CsgH [Rhizobium sp. SYY.PMSO]|uniref:curli-like amyloid fiber formation chaperone CsgH n=1 Tax=Rhizobium sp. SYY.PMSO TaxID=3382192 RepID=UPI00398FE9DD